MTTPRTIYSQSEARRLRAQPCPDCERMSPVHRNLQPDGSGNPDPDMAVTWYCPNVLCNRHDGFWIEEQS